MSIWSPVISTSHASLFDVEYLVGRGRYFSDQFNEKGTLDHRTWPQIPLEVCKFSQAASLPDPCAGFDLPLLFTPSDWRGEIVALVSQDPLRHPKREGSTFTIATPWGFSNRAMHKKAGNKKIWPTIEALCQTGYGVYLTDAAKLYFHHKNQGKWKETSDLENDVLRKEMDALKPKMVIALGNRAADALNNNTIPFSKIPHPTAREKHLMGFYGTKNGKHDEIGEAMKVYVQSKLAEQS